METPSKQAREQIVSDFGVRVTVHKSVRNNWKTTEHRDGLPNVVTQHESRQAAIAYSKQVR